MSQLIYQWIDLIWLPIGWFSVARQHRLKVIIFVLACAITMRTQIELVQSTGFNSGFLPLMDSPLYTRGLIIYSVMIALFLLLAHYSPRTRNIVFFTASLSIYIFAFCVSMVIMLL